MNTETGSTAEKAGNENKTYDFAARVYGPGMNNLSVKDPYSQYQWGLRNDGELQYVEVVNRFRSSNPRLAYVIDLANQLGIPAQVPGRQRMSCRRPILCGESISIFSRPGSCMTAAPRNTAR